MSTERTMDEWIAELTRIKDEIAEWSRRNFPNNTPYDPLLGMGEELGEIKHAVLKMRQGIRGTKAEHEAAIRDGFGDFLIYALDYAGRRGVSEYAMTPMDLEPTRFFGALATDLGEFEWRYQDIKVKSHSAEAAGLRRVLSSCFAVMEGFGLDPIDVLNETWAKVRQRDWTRNAATGEAEKGGRP